ncbi:Superfamily I DNA and RNA helicases and helicase subunits-like [Trichodesmium erythraeum IMS101]|uniref:Superfamily I DNA and RNA helicases and helicase subunits-like n=1 Tax=Trichodesmium erythraeum (strain IMS101) TaxID=203124 RepID=Q111R9_TRIEI|nr:AAA family ATPase [Trichodesmium erythraeum GBRTRLIN201]
MTIFQTNPSNLHQLLQMVKDGDELNLQAGDYKAPFTIDKSITIRGSGSDTVIFAATETPLIITASKVRVENLTVERTVGGDNGEVAIFAEANTNPILSQVKLNGVAENVEWSGVSWNIPTILDFGEIEINRLVEREWELELGSACQVLCDLNWLQVRSSYLSPGRQNLQVVLNTANIPTGTNLSGLIFLSAADSRRELEVTAKVISPLPVTPVLAASTKALPAKVLNSQDWGYRFSGSAADKLVRAQLGEAALKKYPEFPQRRAKAEALMSEILDGNSHLYYVRRQAPGREEGEEIWELTMATDREEQEWEKTLKLRGAVNIDEDRVLKLLSVQLISQKAEKDEFSLALQIRLLPQHQYRRGIPLGVVRSMGKMPFFGDRIPTEEQLPIWTTFVEIEQRIAEKRQFCLQFLSHNYGSAGRKITFEIDVSSATIDGTAESAIDDLELRRRLFEAKNEDIQLFQTSPAGGDARDGEKLGAIATIDWKKGQVGVMLDSEIVEIISRGSYRIPSTGFLFFIASGDIAQVKRKRRALEDLQSGRCQNPYLGDFFFDATCARAPKQVVKLQPQDLLLPAANVNQIAAVETVLASPDLALIQGPPGTGKTTVIAEICYQVALRGGRTLIASQANLAVDNALSRLVHNPVIRAVRKGKAEKVQEEGEPFLEHRVIDTWLKNTANDCESDLDERLQRVEILRNLLIESERFNAYVELEEVWVSQQQELSDRQTILETSREVLASEVLQLETDTKELNFLMLGLDNLLNSAPNVNWQDEEVKSLLPRLQPYSQEEKSVKDLVENVRLARNISRDIGWEIPALGAFGLATWFQENLAILLPEFYNGLAVAKKVTLMMSELENLQQIYQQSHSKFEQLKKDIDNQDIVSENLQKNRQELESQKSQIDLVVSEVGAWINIGKNRIFEELKKCWETDQDFQLDLIGLPESLIKLVNRKKLQLLPEYAQPLHSLPDWERVEKALNAESNRGFQNIRGREHRFDNFLQIILSKPPIVLSERDYQKWQEYAIYFERYSQLNQTSRQGLVEKIQHFFDENRSKYSLVWKADNMLNTLAEVTDKISNKILHHSREMLLPMKRRNQKEILKNKEHLEEISELQKSYKQEREVVEEEGKNLHQKLEQKYQEFINKLTGIEVQLEFNPEIHSLAKKYLESTPLEVLNDQSNFVAKVNSWENNLKQLEKIAPLFEPFTVLTDIKNLLQNKLNTAQEKADKSQEELQSSETEINQIKTALQQEPSITLIEERDWWKSAWKKIPENIKPRVYETEIFAIEILQKIKLQLQNWQQELDTEKTYLNSHQKFIQDWIEKIKKPSEKDSNDLRKIYLDNANVIGITCVQAASRSFAEEFNSFDVVIIDEVSKCTPPEILIPALKGKKLVLVGDHRQLPPMLHNSTIEEIAEEMKSTKEELSFLEESLFKTHFDTATEKIKQMLTIQYRMHPNIMGAINQFYQHRLQCGIIQPNEERAHNLGGEILQDNKHIIWVKMPHLESFIEQKEGTSPFNEKEVDVIEKLCGEMEKSWRIKIAEGFPRKELGIITFYNAQLRLIDSRINPEKFPSLHIRTGTVDRFQGMERQVIIVSMVRNNEEGKVGFAKKPERVNVAFSRAQELLVIVGCHGLFTQHYGMVGNMYSEVSDVVRRQGGLIEFSDILGE